MARLYLRRLTFQTYLRRQRRFPRLCASSPAGYGLNSAELVWRRSSPLCVSVGSAACGGRRHNAAARPWWPVGAYRPFYLDTAPPCRCAAAMPRRRHLPESYVEHCAGAALKIFVRPRWDCVRIKEAALTVADHTGWLCVADLAVPYCTD